MEISAPRMLLFELFDRAMLFFETGRSGPLAVRMGRESYESFLEHRKRKQYAVAMHRLKVQKLIELRKRGNEFLITVTTDGAILALQERIRNKKRLCAAGEYCLVSFDFPEALRNRRVFIRNLLKSAKFKLHHKSVWISRRDVVDELRFLIKLLCAQNSIRIYRAQYMSTKQ